MSVRKNGKLFPFLYCSMASTSISTSTSVSTRFLRCFNPTSPFFFKDVFVIFLAPVRRNDFVYFNAIWIKLTMVETVRCLIKQSISGYGKEIPLKVTQVFWQWHISSLPVTKRTGAEKQVTQSLHPENLDLFLLGSGFNNFTAMKKPSFARMNGYCRVCRGQFAKVRTCEVNAACLTCTGVKYKLVEEFLPTARGMLHQLGNLANCLSRMSSLDLNIFSRPPQKVHIVQPFAFKEKRLASLITWR